MIPTCSHMSFHTPKTPVFRLLTSPNKVLSRLLPSKCKSLNSSAITCLSEPDVDQPDAGRPSETRGGGPKSALRDLRFRGLSLPRSVLEAAGVEPKCETVKTRVTQFSAFKTKHASMQFLGRLNKKSCFFFSI